MSPAANLFDYTFASLLGVIASPKSFLGLRAKSAQPSKSEDELRPRQNLISSEKFPVSGNRKVGAGLALPLGARLTIFDGQSILWSRVLVPIDNSIATIRQSDR